MVFAPRWNRFYLTTRRELEERALQTVLGLEGSSRVTSLVDPAEGVLSSFSSLQHEPRGQAARRLRAAYQALHSSRGILALRAAAALVQRAAARRAERLELSTADIARRIHAIERAVGYADCYPRALMTAYLALTAGIDCVLCVGALVPTRKMHAWCCVGGAVPYEPRPEHYLFQPLWTLTLS